MVSFKPLAAVVLLSATAAPPAFAQAAVQEPGLFSFYYPNLDVLNGGAPRLAGAEGSVRGDRYGSYDFAPDAFPRNHGRRRHRM